MMLKQFFNMIKNLLISALILDFLDEILFDESIGFIENKKLRFAQIESAGVDQLNEAPTRADTTLNAGAQRLHV